jgi:L-ascorbate metabolism protein UlaG (beta-lactamase superfamily)
MEIVWYGLSCFRLSERGLASVVTDPFGPGVGLPALKLKAEIVTVSHDSPGHNFTKAVKGERRIISGPGEFEIGGTFVTGIAMGERKGKKNGRPNTIYLFDFDGIGVVHMGDLADVPSQAQIEELGAIGVALVPVGGGSALSPSQAAEVISMIEPSIVVPMHYKTGQLDLKLGTVNRFLSEMGIKDVQPAPSLKVSSSDLTDETRVVVLEPSS